MLSIFEKIQHIPNGYSEVMYEGNRYGLSRKDFNGGKSIKVFAEQLGGKDFISFNYYLTSEQHLLKPCEMPTEKVRQFLLNFQLLPASS
ncbi:MAG: peptide methionine sulfoxide reductase [Saprospiraceae bacterium]|nr:peptide methionine sulfoxide reductase [Saprospiraceae bacterium]